MKATTAILMTSLGIILQASAWAASASLPPTTYTKVTVTFSPANFSLSYGQTGKICAVVKPARLATKLSWVNSPSAPGVFSITPGIDPDCNGGAGVSLSLTSAQSVCLSSGSIQAMFNGKTIATAGASITLPTSEYAVLLDSGSNLNPGCNTPGLGCFFKDYAVVFPPPNGGALNLSGVTILERLAVNQQQCSFPTPQGTSAPAQLSPSLQLWGVEDHNEIPGGEISFPPGTSSCTDVFLQTVFAGACQIQTNTLTYTADNFGDRSITRSDSSQ